MLFDITNIYIVFIMFNCSLGPGQLTAGVLVVISILSIGSRVRCKRAHGMAHICVAVLNLHKKAVSP